MKCGYDKCKFGGEVEKSEAIKDGRYYHKKCLKEKRLKLRIVDEFYKKCESNEPLSSVRGAVKKYIHELGYDAEYVLYCLLYVSRNLKYMNGLIYLLSDERNMSAYKRAKARANRVEPTKPDEDIYDQDSVKIEREEDKRWGDVFV